MENDFSTDYEVLLKEISQIKAALEPDENLDKFANSNDEDEIDCEEPLAGNLSDDLSGSDEEYHPNSEVRTKSSAWYDQDFHRSDSESDEGLLPYGDTNQPIGAKVLTRSAASNPGSSTFIRVPLEEGDNEVLATEECTLTGSKSPFADVSLAESAKASGLPLSSLECALQLNRDYQEILKDELIKISCALKNNQKIQFDIEEKKNAWPMFGKYAPLLGRFKKSYFRDQFYQGPPDNEDTREREQNTRVNPFAKNSRLWSEKERQLLSQGVRNQNLEMMTFKLKAELNELERQATKNKMEVDQNMVDDLRRRLKELKNLPKEKVEENIDGLDFFSISKLYLPYRTEAQCRIRWLVSDHPRINQTPWTQEEDTKLIDVAREHKNRNWEKIAQEMGTLRTPIQCFQRFQRSLNKHLLKRGWTAEEDEELTRVMQVCKNNDWQQIASLIEGRAGMQILHHWQKTLRPGLRKGKFSDRENELLVKYTNLLGPGNWMQIAKYIPGRTDASVRDRWVNNYAPGLKLNVPWTKEEDELLMASVAKYKPGNWTKICSEVPGRTDNRCWRRWQIIQKEEARKYIASVHKKKQLLSYFVGRAHERPELDIEKVNLPGYKGLKKRRKRKQKRVYDKKSGKAQSKTSDSKPSAVKVKQEKIEYVDEDCDEFGKDGEHKANKEEEDPDYEVEESDSEYTYTYSSGDDDDDEPQNYTDLSEEGCARFIESGNNILHAFRNGNAKYIDVKRELFLLKIKILKSTQDKTRIRLQALNDEQFREMEEIRLSHKAAEPVSDSSDDEPTSVQVKRPGLPQRPELPIEDTVLGPANIGIKSIRPVAVGQMPENLAPFTMLLEAFHIDIKSVMQAVNSQPTLNQQETATSSSPKPPDYMPEKLPAPFPTVIPIAPNLVTLQGFRKLLLLRRRLVELSSLVPATQSERAIDQQLTGIESFNKKNTNQGNCTRRKAVKEPSPRKRKRGRKKLELPNLCVNTTVEELSRGLETGNASTTAAPSRSSTPDASKPAYEETHAYKALFTRFNSLFLWPALLSTHIAREPVLRSAGKRKVPVDKEDNQEGLEVEPPTRKKRKVRKPAKKKLKSISESSHSDSWSDQSDDYEPDLDFVDIGPTDRSTRSKSKRK